LPIELETFESILNTENANKWSVFFQLSTDLSSQSESYESMLEPLSILISGILEKGDNLKNFIATYKMFIETQNDQDKETLNNIKKFLNAVIVAVVDDKIAKQQWENAREILLTFNDPNVVRQVNPNILLTPHYSQLIPAIKFINLLPAIALENMASIYHVSEYETIFASLGASDQDESQKFLQRLKIVQARRMLSHSWSAAKNYKFMNFAGEMEELGTSVGLQRLELIKSLSILSSLVDEGKELMLSKVPTADSVFVDELFQRVIKDLQNLPPCDIKLQQTDPDIVILKQHQSLDEQHSIACAIWADQFCIVNRSDSRESGIRVFKISDESKVRLMGLLNSNVPSSTIEDELKKNSLEISIPMKAQTIGNCAWVATKALVWSAFYFETLKLLKEKNITTENNLVASNIATQMYKRFNSARKIQLLDQYLAVADQDELESHTQMLADIRAKSIKRGIHVGFHVNQERADISVVDLLKSKIKKGECSSVAKLLPFLRINQQEILILAVEQLANHLTSTKDVFDNYCSILRELDKNGITKFDSAGYFSITHFFDDLTKDKKMLSENFEFALNALRELEPATPEVLAYRIMNADFHGVENFVSNLQIAPTPDNFTKLMPFELALKSLVGDPDASEDRIKVIEVLVQNDTFQSQDQVKVLVRDYQGIDSETKTRILSLFDVSGPKMRLA